MNTDTTGVDRNVELVRDAFAAFNKGDIDACLARITPDFIINMAGAPQQLRGQEIWKQGLEIMRHGFPDIEADIEDIFGSGDRVAVRLTFRGTHTGEFQGIPATGRKIEYMSNEFYRVENGLLAEEWICSDIAGLMGQIS